MKKRSPWLFIPSMYFAEGLPFIIVNNFSVVMFKSLGVSNELIGFTSFLYLPWSLKFLWAPFVDGTSTKRNWLRFTQIALAVCFGLLAFGVNFEIFFPLSLVFFTLAAFSSATHDIATDGFYLYALNQKDQALFTGIRATFYRLSMIFGSGFLVIIAGDLGDRYGNPGLGWSAALGISAVMYLIFFTYHSFILPKPESDKAARSISGRIPFAEAFKNYFSQKKILPLLLFILLYRLGEGMLVKMAQPFLMDPQEAGGLNVSVQEVGFYYGTVGTIALVIGGILGGWLIKRYSLKKLIWPMALAMNTPNLLYAFLAFYQPDSSWSIDLSGILSSEWAVNYNLIVQISIVIEQFGYGLGFTAFMVYLLYASRGKLKTTFYAISTGIMAVGMMIPGFLSGWLQSQVGYLWLFILTFLFAIPGMLVIFFLPIEEQEKNDD